MTLEEFLENVGLYNGTVPPIDGNIHRWAIKDQTNPDCWGWFLQTPTGIIGKCGDWHNGDTTFTYSPTGRLTQEQKDIVRAANSKFRKTQMLQQKEAARQAKTIYAGAFLDEKVSAYVKRKKIRPYTAKFDGQKLVLPIRDLKTHEIVSLQYIFEDGTKRYLPFGRTKGCGIILEGDPSKTYVVEGYADGCVLHQVTGNKVVIAGYAGNLAEVVKNLEDKNVIIGGDNDPAGIAGAENTHRPVVYPGNHKDFNDLFLDEGSDGVLRELNKLLSPAKLKDSLAEQEPISAGELALSLFSYYDFARSNENLYYWTGNKWELTHHQYASFVRMVSSIEPDNWFGRDRLTNMYYKLLASLPVSVEINSVPDHYIPLQDGVYNLLTGEMEPHRKEFYYDRYIPHVLDNKDTKMWKKVLDDFKLTDEQVAFLQEFFGYCLLPHARYRKACWLYGPKRTAKSFIIGALLKMVGTGNFSNVTPSKLGDPSEMSALVGKMVNYMDEIEEKALGEGAGFKRLVSTGNPVLINEKFISRYTYAPTCCHIFASNTLPYITDKSDATWDRITFIEMSRQFAEHQQDDNLLAKIPVSEILTWAIEGAKRLLKTKGLFTPVKGSQDIIADISYYSDHVARFAEAMLTRKDSSFVPMNKLRDEFRKFCGMNWSDPAISKEFKRAGYKIEPRKLPGEKNIRALIGFDLL